MVSVVQRKPQHWIVGNALSDNIEESEPKSIYNVSLLHAFIANVFQLIALSLLFRYSDFIQNLGGDESHLGWVVGLATVGAIFFRLVQGFAIDRFGPKQIWLLSLAVQIIALWWHTRIQSVTSVDIYLARGLFALGIAGNFGAWLSFVSLQAPVHRVAEVIGVIGASGFVGMATGPVIGDYIFAVDKIQRTQIDQMFWVALSMAAGAFVFAGLACWSAGPIGSTSRHKTRPIGNPLTFLWKNRPGFILVVGMMMGLSIGFAGTYLRPLAESLGINQIKTFFVVYNVTAFVSRLLFRRTPEILGLKNTICLGFGFFFLSMLCYLGLKSESGFWLPAIAGGLGHSFLFPSVVAACTEQFDQASRGIATNLILAMYDAGVFVGMPAIGLILTTARANQLPAYPSAIFFICFLILLVVSTFYLQKPGQKSG